LFNPCRWWLLLPGFGPAVITDFAALYCLISSMRDLYHHDDLMFAHQLFMTSTHRHAMCPLLSVVKLLKIEVVFTANRSRPATKNEIMSYFLSLCQMAPQNAAATCRAKQQVAKLQHISPKAMVNFLPSCRFPLGNLESRPPLK
jgi:hypothetical protein